MTESWTYIAIESMQVALEELNSRWPICFSKPLKISVSDVMFSLVALLKSITSLDKESLSVFLTDGVQHRSAFHTLLPLCCDWQAVLTNCERAAQPRWTPIDRRPNDNNVSDRAVTGLMTAQGCTTAPCWVCNQPFCSSSSSVASTPQWWPN